MQKGNKIKIIPKLIGDEQVTPKEDESGIDRIL